MVASALDLKSRLHQLPGIVLQDEFFNVVGSKTFHGKVPTSKGNQSGSTSLLDCIFKLCPRFGLWIVDNHCVVGGHHLGAHYEEAVIGKFNS